MKAHNIVDKTYGRLIVARRGGTDKHGNSQWWCRCKCGKGVLCSAHNLKAGRTRSCGCLKQGKIAETEEAVNT